MNAVTGLILTVVAALMLLSPVPAQAKIYKCVGGDGSISYTQRPCAPTEQTSKVLQGAAARERFDCRVARAFSTHIAGQMKAGKTADDMFSEYGGLNSISPTTVSVINYVFSHKGNVDTSINRISALSGARCESGSYSRNIQCPDFPPSFISEMGGCSVLKGESPKPPGQNVPVSNSASDEQPTAQRTRNKNYDVLEETADTRQANCRESIGSKIKEIQTQMRGRLSVDEHNELNDERNVLRNSYEEC